MQLNKLTIKATLFRDKLITHFEIIKKKHQADLAETGIENLKKSSDKTDISENLSFDIDRQISKDILQDLKKEITLNIDKEKFVHKDDSLIESLRSFPSPLKEQDPLDMEKLAFNPETGFQTSPAVLKKLNIPVKEEEAPKLIFNSQTGTFSASDIKKQEEKTDIKELVPEEIAKAKKFIDIINLPSSNANISINNAPENKSTNAPVINENDKLLKTKLIPKLKYDHKTNKFIVPDQL
jgi:hypothetical protein